VGFEDFQVLRWQIVGVEDSLFCEFVFVAYLLAKSIYAERQGLISRNPSLAIKNKCVFRPFWVLA
jgi:hypothetical protein